MGVCIIGVNCPLAPSTRSATSITLHRNRVTWVLPTVGTAFQSWVYRITGAIVTPTSVKTLVGGVPVPASTLTVVDPDELSNGVQYTYFTIAEFNDGPPHTFSPPSNFVTVIAVNDAPVADGQSVTKRGHTEGDHVDGAGRRFGGIAAQHRDRAEPRHVERHTAERDLHAVLELLRLRQLHVQGERQEVALERPRSRLGQPGDRVNHGQSGE